MKLGFSTRACGAWKILAVRGDIDLATASSLQEQLSALIAGGADLIAADLEGVNFLDSTGLRVLAGVVRELPEGGRFAVITTQAKLLKVFHLTAMQAVLTICASEADLPA